MSNIQLPLIPGAPTATGTYFAVMKPYVGDRDEMVVIHYQADKGVYYAYGVMSRPVKAEDVIGFIPREQHEERPKEISVFVPCQENDPRSIGGYTSYDGRSLCYVREITVPVIEKGAVWVKASDFNHEVGIPYHAKDSRFKGAGVFNAEGAFKWGDGTITFPRDQEDLLILDESPSKEGNKEREMYFAEWLQENRWFSFENGKWYYTFEQGTCMSDKEYQKKYVKTTAELWNEWDNQQNNNHDKTHR
jgi:hypothetical protein